MGFGGWGPREGRVQRVGGLRSRHGGGGGD